MSTRDNYLPGGGKLFDENDNVVDVTQKMINTTEPFSGITKEFVLMDNRFHVLIEEGEVFTANSTLTIATGTSEYAEVRTGAKRVSYKPTTYMAEGENVLIELFEDSTIGTPGSTEVITHNRNRNSMKTPDAKIYSDPVVTSDGERLDVLLASSGGATSKVLSFAGGIESEWDLKPNTSYIFKYTNLGNSDTKLHISNLFYEEVV